MHKHFFAALLLTSSLSGLVPLGADAAAKVAPVAASTPLAATIARANTAIVVIETTRPQPSGTGRRVGGQARHGSGFVIDERGYILTNNHVIAGAVSVRARFANGTVLAASVVGADPRTDLAVLKIEASEKLPTLSFARQPAALAQDVIALGAPLDFAWSATFGRISGDGRAYDSVDGVDYLQHDAALNPGNSGGPLIGVDGLVIGVNTATPRETLFDIGIGLAIPAAIAQAVATELITSGRVSRGWLGVDVQPVQPGLAVALGADGVDGLAVEVVATRSPAAQAGLKVGDVIVSVDGKPGRQVRDLSRRLLASRPGDVVRLELRRGGRTLAFDTALGSEPVQPPRLADSAAARGSAKPAHDMPMDAGLAFDDAVAWSRDGTPSAARIVSVRAGSVADRFGLQPGDGVVAVNRTMTPDGPAAAAEIEQAIGDHVALLVRRPEGDQIYVLLPRTEAALAALDAGGQGDDAPRGFL